MVVKVTRFKKPDFKSSYESTAFKDAREKLDKENQNIDLDVLRAQEDWSHVANQVFGAETGSIK